MKFRVVISNETERLIWQQAEYLAEQSSWLAATNWLKGLYDKIETLEMFPGRYPIAPESRDCLFEIRMLIYGDYLILFRINNDVVEVLHFRHGARKQSSSQ